MSRYAWLACPEQRLMIWLGKVISDAEGGVHHYRIGDRPGSPNSANERLNRTLWKFMADTAGHDLCVITDTHPEYQRLDEYREIGGDEIGDIPVDRYLDSWTDDPPDSETGNNRGSLRGIGDRYGLAGGGGGAPAGEVGG